MLACCPPPPPHTIQAALDGRSVQSLACCQDVPPHDPNSVWWKDGAKFSVMFPPPHDPSSAWFVKCAKFNVWLTCPSMIQTLLDSWSVQSFNMLLKCSPHYPSSTWWKECAKLSRSLLHLTYPISLSVHQWAFAFTDMCGGVGGGVNRLAYVLHAR